MSETILKITPPPDRITQTPEGRFHGSAYVFGKDGQIQEVNFDIIPSRPLPDFYYNKPVPDQDLLRGPARFERDKKPRSGYYPLAIINDSRRLPNHMYRSDDAILAAVNVGTNEEPKWETRYFPKGCIEPQTWSQALEILEIK